VVLLLFQLRCIHNSVYSGTEGFRLSGGNIIFASAPTTGADFFGIILAGADYVNAGGNFPSGTAAVPSITFNDDLDTGIYNSGINQVSITTGGSERLRIDSAGQIESVSLGTAAAPAFSFTTDPNTGIYSPGADQVAISTNGTGRLFVDASGNVGLGDSTPQRDAGTTSLAIGDGSKATSVDLYGTVKNYAIYNGGSGQLGVFDLSSSTERITLTSAGRVGIGTSSPGFPIETKLTGVDSTIWGYNVAQFADATANNTGLRIGTNTSTTGLTQLIAATSSAASQFGFWTYNGSSWGERLRITSAGNVGIGTTSPGSTLDVVGGINASSSYSTSTDSFIYSYSGSTLGVVRSGALFDGTNKALRFYTDALERGRFDSSGRLLVGTSSARSNFFNGTGTAALQVEGVTNDSSALSIIRNSNDIARAILTFAKTRGGSVGSTTIVQNGDEVGQISFQASDGTEFVECANILAVVDGTPGANDMPGRLVFSTTADGASSPTERMRINSSGAFKTSANGTYKFPDGVTEIVHNDTSSSIQLIASNTSFAGDAVTISTYRNTVNDSYKFLSCVRQGFAFSLEIRDDGDVYNANGTYGSLSDVKLKENIVDAQSQWDDIKQLRVRNYNFKPETNNSTHKQIGVIAQEIENVSPGLVNTVSDRDAEGNDLGTVTKSVNYSVLYMKAVKALQEAMERIETLQGMVAVNNMTIDEQQHQISALATRLTALESA
jgi:hypothetical protein